MKFARDGMTCRFGCREQPLKMKGNLVGLTRTFNNEPWERRTIGVGVPETGRHVSQFPRWVRLERRGKKAVTCPRTPKARCARNGLPPSSDAEASKRRGHIAGIRKRKARKGNGFDANSPNFTNLEDRNAAAFDLPSFGLDAPPRRDFKAVLVLARQVIWSTPPTRPCQMKWGKCLSVSFPGR